MNSDEGKLFVGGVSWETSEEKLKEHFGQYGEVAEAVIMKDKMTGKPRGFAFVVFSDPADLDLVLLDKHAIDGRTVEAKRALSREEQQTTSRSGNPNVGRATGGGGGGNFRTKKIFVGGLPPTISDDGFRMYFEQYGNVTDVVVMYDQNTQRPRGFGFISFDTEEAVDRVLHKTFHELNGKLVEVKRALPKDANPSSGSRGGGSYQSYGASGANTNSYIGRTDASRYVQPQAAGGGYPAYGSSGYGFGATSNGVGYGGYGVGGYGSGPTGAYGNPNAPGPGYGGGLPGAPRSPWNNQASSGYGSAGYGGSTGYGAGAAWNNPAGGGGAVGAPAGQSPGGATGYGSQGYGHSGYGGTAGSYGNQSGYGAVGGRGSAVPTSNPAGVMGEQGAPSGYMGGGYASGASAYPSTWSDPSQGGSYGSGQGNWPPGGPGSYNAGYGGPPRQAQQQ